MNLVILSLIVYAGRLCVFATPVAVVGLLVMHRHAEFWRRKAQKPLWSRTGRGLFVIALGLTGAWAAFSNWLNFFGAFPGDLTFVPISLLPLASMACAGWIAGRFLRSRTPPAQPGSAM